MIVDDEPLARRLLVSLLRDEEDMTVSAECATAEDAIDALSAVGPDLLFLDIEMPGCSGLELARQLDPGSGPVVVFVTAHSGFAADAFDLSPVDYLVKPLQTARWRRALQRVRRALAFRAGVDGSEATACRPSRYLERTFVRNEGRIHPVRLADVILIEAVGNYVKLHTATRSYLLRCTLGAMELRLDPRQFIRVHRSTIVNVDMIRDITIKAHGDYTVVLAGNRTVPLSRRYRDRLDRFSVAGEAIDR